MARKPQGPHDDPSIPMEPESRLPTEPWMKYTGVSGLAALIVWFRTPKRIRSQTLRGAWMAMLIFGALIGVLFGIAGLVLLVDWALHG